MSERSQKCSRRFFAKTGESDLIFSVVPNSYRSLVGANTPRGSDITGKPFLWIVSPYCVLPHDKHHISLFNQQHLHCRWSKVRPVTTCATSYPDCWIETRPTKCMSKQARTYSPKVDSGHLCARYVALLQSSGSDGCAYGARTCKSARRGRVTFQFVRTSRS